jgi:hypothetical protein
MNKKQILNQLIDHDDLKDDTKFYRWTSVTHLSASNDGLYSLEARKEATEMVEDIYDQGHLIMAKYVGPGLSFTLSKNNDYADDSKVCVSITLKQFIEQGGLLFNDKSSHVEGAYFLMLAEGNFRVMKED